MLADRKKLSVYTFYSLLFKLSDDSCMLFCTSRLIIFHCYLKIGNYAIQSLKYLPFVTEGMKTEDFNDYLREHQIHVFSIYDAAKIVSKSHQYTSKFLAKDKFIKRAKRGLYYTGIANEYEVASRVIFPSYISLISALRFHNLTEQIPHIIFVMSSVQHRPISDLNGFGVQFKRLKKRLFYGYGKVDGVYVAEPEKAVIDMMYLNEFVDYAEEAIEGGKLDKTKLNEYAVRSGVKKIIKRVEAISDVK